MSKLIKIFFLLNLLFLLNVHCDEHNFENWLESFKLKATKSGISKIVDEIMSEAKFLPKVIEYDRYQPEFYEDTFTYIKKRFHLEKFMKD